MRRRLMEENREIPKLERQTAPTPQPPQPEHPPLPARPISYHEHYHRFQFSSPYTLASKSEDKPNEEHRQDNSIPNHTLVMNMHLPIMRPPPLAERSEPLRLPPVPKAQPYGVPSPPRLRMDSLPGVSKYLRQRNTTYQLPPISSLVQGPPRRRPSLPTLGRRVGVLESENENKRKLSDSSPRESPEGGATISRQKRSKSLNLILGSTNEESPSHSNSLSGSESGGSGVLALNDWESIVSMYLTGAGTHDGKALKELRRGEGSQGGDRKILEKRRTVGKAFEKLGRPLFEETIGYKQQENGTRKKQKMYIVIARCRALNQLVKRGVYLPTDAVELNNVIDAQILEKSKARNPPASASFSNLRLPLPPPPEPGHSMDRIAGPSRFDRFE